jgi:hypothetical protein
LLPTGASEARNFTEHCQLIAGWIAEEFTEFIKRAKRMERKLISSREQNIKKYNRNHKK